MTQRLPWGRAQRSRMPSGLPHPAIPRCAPASVSATYASFTKRQVEDQAVVTLGYPGGAIGVVETGF